jgi:hypothetical protein
MLVVSIITPGLKAQDIERPFKVGVLLGPSFNIGKSGSSDLDSSSLQSAAKTGFNVAFTLTYRFPNSFFGIYGIGSWQRNEVDSKEFTKQFIPDNGNPFAIVINSGPLITWKFLAGPDIKLPLGTNGKYSIEFSLAGGALEAIAPNYTITGYHTNGSDMEYHYGGRMDLVFCFQLSSGFNYQINQRCSMVINASYSNGTPGYKQDIGINNFEYHYNYTYPISSLNIMAGVSYSL